MDLPEGQFIEVRGANLWHRITGEGEPVVQIHGAGFGHFNLDPVTPAIADAGFRLEHLSWFNRVGVFGWWLNARVRKVPRIPLAQLRMFDAFVPLLTAERFVPLPFGQSLVAVGRRDG